MLSYSVSTLAASSSVGFDFGRIVALPKSNSMPWMTPVNFFTCSGISSGHPSSSWKPFLVSGLSGHLSCGIGMPSLSESLSGQPSGGTPGSVGHLSSGFRMLSLSGSLSGQPSGGMPGSVGHLSCGSMMPSLSVSGGGQPSGATPGTVGHLSSGSLKPSPSVSFGCTGGGGSSFLPRPIVYESPSKTSG